MHEKEILEDALELSNDPFKDVGESDPITSLGKILALLSNSDRNILIYKYFLNYNDSQIAALIGVKPDSVRMALTRARRKVRELWKEKEEVSL